MLLLSFLLAVPVRVTFLRTIRPVHDINAERVAVIYAIGDHEKVLTFVDYFVEYAARAGTLRVENAVENNQHAGFSEKALSRLRKEHPADAYVGVSLFTCAGAERNGEVGDTNSSGDRIHTKMQWLDAVCSAKLDVRAANGKRVTTFMTHGEGTSPRAAALGADEREVAYEQAARFAALAAAESIMPRVTRESIELDETAPAFEDALALVNSDRLGDARAIWEAALNRHRNSAALQFNLGAICEAMGDFNAAAAYYESAVKLAPKQSRYRSELNLFRRRNGVNR
jgi:tetratricopeptide (TPR) repeat protein